MLCWQGPGTRYCAGRIQCCAGRVQEFDLLPLGLGLLPRQVGPSILTSRQLLEAAWYYAKKAAGLRQPAFQPRFSEGVQHFLIHAGGAKVQPLALGLAG